MTRCCLLPVLLGLLASSCGAWKLESSQSQVTTPKALRLQEQGVELQSPCACTTRTGLEAAHVPEQATLVAGKPFCVHKPGEIPADRSFYRMRQECFQHRDKVADCLPHNDARTLYLIGDCHAYINTQPGLQQATSLPLYFYGNNLPTIESNEGVFQAVIDRLRAVLKPNDLVVFSEILTGDDSKSPVSQAQLDSFKDRLMKTSALCTEKQAQMVIMGDTPALALPAFLCSAGKPCSTSEADIRGQQKAKRDILASVLQMSPSIKWFDYLHLFCNNGICDQFIPGTKIEAFHDDDHLNKKGAQYLWPFMCEWLHDQNLL